MVLLLETSQIQRIMFVCLGNICRSPMAEGVFYTHSMRAGLSETIKIASAGTGGWHVGSAPDERAIAAAHARGFDISQQVARQVTDQDFQNFDLICAMDQENLATLEQKMRQNGACQTQLCLFMDFAPGLKGVSVPDPYYGGLDGFERVLDMLEQASSGLIDQLTSSASG